MLPGLRPGGDRHADARRRGRPGGVPGAVGSCHGVRVGVALPRRRVVERRARRLSDDGAVAGDPIGDRPAAVVGHRGPRQVHRAVRGDGRGRRGYRWRGRVHEDLRGAGRAAGVAVGVDGPHREGGRGARREALLDPGGLGDVLREDAVAVEVVVVDLDVVGRRRPARAGRGLGRRRCQDPCRSRGRSDVPHPDGVVDAAVVAVVAADDVEAAVAADRPRDEAAYAVALGDLAGHRPGVGGGVVDLGRRLVAAARVAAGDPDPPVGGSRSGERAAGHLHRGDALPAAPRRVRVVHVDLGRRAAEQVDAPVGAGHRRGARAGTRQVGQVPPRAAVPRLHRGDRAARAVDPAEDVQRAIEADGRRAPVARPRDAATAVGSHEAAPGR